MSKLLFLCRHAEAEDTFGGQPDFNRCLTAVGIMQASQAARWLQYRFLAESIICSPAERTMQTARLLAVTIGLSPESLVFKPELYNASVGTLTNIIMQLPDNLNKIVLVGHNPGITKVLEELTGKAFDYMEPGCMAAISFEADSWQQAITQPGTLVEIFKPGKE